MSRIDSEHAPHGLELVIDFVNTLDVETAADSIAHPAELGAWLAERGLLVERAAISPGEHAAALRLREALRDLMLANNERDGDVGPAWSELERTARDGELAVHFTGAGAVSVAPRAGGVEGALSKLLVPVAAGLADGSWARVKACRAVQCEWAFYDRSRNRSGVWCDMAVCGNRTKVRAYRSRGTAKSSG
ncbi:MAG TPA: CGNR zinc finger domain-containing protein [Solirubrobacteraceae bacterium]